MTNTDSENLSPFAAKMADLEKKREKEGLSPFATRLAALNKKENSSISESVNEVLESDVNNYSEKEEIMEETITIEGIEYPMDTTTIDIKEEITSEIKAKLLKLKSLKTLWANKALNIPKELVNITELYAQTARNIPKELINLKELLANNAESIPKELVNLTELYASRAESIPKELVNLTILLATSAKKIPKELVKLKELHTKCAVDIKNFPNIETLNGEKINKSASVKKKVQKVLESPSTIEDIEELEKAISSKEKQDDKFVIIEETEYSLDTEEITIEGEITPEIEKALLKLSNLTVLHADASRNIPNGLTNLTRLYANSARSIPNTLVNLETLIAPNMRRVPSTLINLKMLDARGAKELGIPNTLTKLENIFVSQERAIFERSGLGEDANIYAHFPNLKNCQEIPADNSPEWLDPTDIKITIEGNQYPLDTKRITIRGKLDFKTMHFLKAFPNLFELELWEETELPEELSLLTKLNKLNAPKAKNIPNGLTGLRELYANKAKEIPSELIYLEILCANNAKEIPDTLINLQVLEANHAQKIPNTLINLIRLEANRAQKIPKELINLRTLEARYAEEIPKELTKLKDLVAHNCRINVKDFPNLKELNGKVVKNGEKTEEDAPSSIIDYDALPRKYVTIEGEAYGINETNVSIKGAITPEIEEALLKLPKITYLYANNTSYIPALPTLKILHADSIVDIPNACTQLEEIYANNIQFLSRKLVNLRILHANDVEEIPQELTKLKEIHAELIRYLPDTLVNLEVLRAKYILEIPETLTKLKTLFYETLEEPFPNTLVNLKTLSIKKNIQEIPVEVAIKIKQLKCDDEIDIDDFPSLEYLWDNDKKAYRQVEREYGFDPEESIKSILWNIKTTKLKKKIKKGVKNLFTKKRS